MAEQDTDLYGELVEYYTWLFPYELLEQWMKLNKDDKSFQNREFGFIMNNGTFARYFSFDSTHDLKRNLKKLLPDSIHIGAVYAHKPREHRKYVANELRHRELVFDIDIDSYGDIRKCCKGATVCRLCWKFLALAVKIINRALIDDFGLQDILWVYSGRRGVHCWVSDVRSDVSIFNIEQRAAVLSYLSVVKSSTRNALEVDAVEHWSIQKALAIIDVYFEEILEDHKQMEEHDSALMKALPERIAQEAVEIQQKHKTESTIEKWHRLLNVLQKPYVRQMYPNLLEKIKLYMCYPRFDEMVTVQPPHLLRMPFSIHPSTRQVCVPFEVCEAFSFDPSQVPTSRSLSAELHTSTYPGEQTPKAKVLNHGNFQLYTAMLKTWLSKRPTTRS